LFLDLVGKELRAGLKAWTYRAFSTQSNNYPGDFHNLRNKMHRVTFQQDGLTYNAEEGQWLYDVCEAAGGLGPIRV